MSKPREALIRPAVGLSHGPRKTDGDVASSSKRGRRMSGFQSCDLYQNIRNRGFNQDPVAMTGPTVFFPHAVATAHALGEHRFRQERRPSIPKEKLFFDLGREIKHRQADNATHNDTDEKRSRSGEQKCLSTPQNKGKFHGHGDAGQGGCDGTSWLGPRNEKSQKEKYKQGRGQQVDDFHSQIQQAVFQVTVFHERRDQQAQ